MVTYTSDAATDEQFERLEDLLDASEEARAFYVRAIDLHAKLYWYRRRRQDVESRCRPKDVDPFLNFHGRIHRPRAVDPVGS